MRAIKLSMLVLGMLCAVSAQARDWATIKLSGTIEIVTEGSYPPFTFVDNGKLTGYEIEAYEAVAKKLGVKIHWSTLGFDALIAAVHQDRFDMAVSSHGITPEREKAVDFASPHYCSGGQIVSRGNGPQKAADLKGKIIGVQLATTYADAAKKVGGVKEVRTFPRDTDVLQALMGNRIDAWVTDRFVAKSAIEKNPSFGLKAGDMLFIERIAGVMQKGNTSLHEQVNKAIAEAKADGTLKAISQKYFKEDIACPN
jgi:polar amino acid transport system substrate-binding protein